MTLEIMEDLSHFAICIVLLKGQKYDVYELKHCVS